jgi:hypothetical protein
MKYARRVYPSKGDASISDTPIALPYNTKGNGQITGKSVNITKTVYKGGIATQGVSKQK